MKKDTFYFSHDYDASNDPKLQEVLMEHGVAGWGVFWYIVERLYEQGGRLPLKQCKCIAFALHADCNMVESVVKNFGLFDNDGQMFWSNSVNKRLDKRQSIQEKRKHAALSRWKSNIKKQDKTGSNALASNMDANALQNDAKERKVKESKELLSTDVSNNSVNSSIVNDSPINASKEKCKKERLGDAGKTKRFVPPTMEEVRDYIIGKGSAVDAERFWNFYESKGWMVGKNKMKDWKAAIRTWERNNGVSTTTLSNNPVSSRGITLAGNGVITSDGTVYN